MKLPDFETKDELFKYLVDNKKSLIAQKKATIKEADVIYTCPEVENINKNTTKANTEFDKDILTVKVIMNTTNLLDSHEDVHIPGIWNKTLKDKRFLFHLQEHISKFDKIIADGKNVKAYLQDFPWKELNYNYKGNTQALMFESNIEEKRNSFMFEQYKNGYVSNHSVGMQYVKIELCINSEKSEYKTEKEAWNKYFNMVANYKDAEELGYFWAVTEAKLFEGSAVVRGSNFATPTISINEPSKDTQTNNDTQKEPSFYQTLNKLI